MSDTKQTNVVAVVVTYNKPQLLQLCVSAILNQTYPVNRVLVIDNGGLEDTRKVIEQLADDKISHVLTGENLGGAGGFKFGINAGMDHSADFLWVMDDDTVPDLSALSAMMEANSTLQSDGINPGFLSSNVRWTDMAPAKMNIPGVAEDWSYEVRPGLVKLTWASFVSLLINTEAINKVGLPIDAYFIWGDDVEYSRRISTSFPSFFVQDSIAVHHMDANVGANILEEKNKNRVSRYYFAVRNELHTVRELGTKSELMRVVSKDLAQVFKVMGTGFTGKKIAVTIRGFFAGLFFNPRIDFHKSNGQ
ncbi:glycosyltransferase [Lacticaseibacillus pantheris]|uniref:glycosyltransferase n=1 Tax=Lacticaseibacillus pantheris TaxID=171523 RepID=UPI000704BF43|nr:glycosyltransferase [Lacticaseibacillus pantheris]